MAGRLLPAAGRAGRATAGRLWQQPLQARLSFVPPHVLDHVLTCLHLPPHIHHPPRNMCALLLLLQDNYCYSENGVFKCPTWQLEGRGCVA